MQEPERYTLTLAGSINEADHAFVVERLLAFNIEHSEAYRQLRQPEHAAQPLEIFLRDSSGAIVGGLIAETYWGWLCIYKLWLDARVRGGGYGTKLVQMAEDEARRRGCRFSRLETFGFQARGFYEKLGYRVVGCYEDYPPGSVEYHLRKDFEGNMSN
jgi:GNAT superfamily N-acetyltransferase